MTHEGTLAYIDDIARHEGQRVIVRGWLHARRSSGKIHFLTVRDGSGFIQGVMSESGRRRRHVQACRSPDAGDVDHRLGSGPCRLARAGGFELDLATLEVVGRSVDYPITPKEHGVDYLMDRRHLWIRSERQSPSCGARRSHRGGALVLRRPRVHFLPTRRSSRRRPAKARRRSSPSSTSTRPRRTSPRAASSTTRPTRWPSPRLLLRPDVPGGEVEDAPPSLGVLDGRTEVAFAKLDDVIELAEDLVVSVVTRVLERRQTELRRLDRDMSKLELVKKPFPRITYDDAVRMLNEKGQPFEWGGDFGAPDETLLAGSFDRPVAVTRYPSEGEGLLHGARPAAARRRPVRGRAGARGLWRDHRWQRAHRELRPAPAADQGTRPPPEAFEWYLDLRRYGTVPHGGFGMGIERVVTWICGLDHLREAIPYARTLNRLYP